MERKLSVFMFGIILGLILLAGFVLAAQPVPHAFEGTIKVDDGTDPNLMNLTARLDGAVTGLATIEGNSFKITVVDYKGYGGEISFYIGDEEAEESFDFEKFGINKTNLTFKTIPEETFGRCGDRICAVEECSFCAIDCSASQCNTNNVCDEAIGEDYLTAPNDCTTCGDGHCTGDETCSTCSTDCGPCNNNNKNPSGGGGGGGGSPTYTPTTSENESETNNTQDSTGLTIDELNERDSELDQNPRQGFFRATGQAISNFSSSKFGKGTIIVFALAVLLGIGLFVKNKLKK